jgi:hypothetical protein
MNVFFLAEYLHATAEKGRNMEEVLLYVYV